MKGRSATLKARVAKKKVGKRGKVGKGGEGGKAPKNAKNVSKNRRQGKPKNSVSKVPGKLGAKAIRKAMQKIQAKEEEVENCTEAKTKRRRRISKAELKSVIYTLNKDPNLSDVLKTLKYIPHYLKSEGLTKKLLKVIIKLWAEAGEKIRVVCLLCLIRIYTKLEDKEGKQMIVKKLYTTFLDKCRVTKQETMSMIGFMRHSLIELYKLDPKIAFAQAQTSCQQLTITLKNAYNHKNEETYKTVLNWQFANCLILLSNLIISHDDDSPVKSLTHQVIQLNLGALNFLNSPRYYPFYCHLIENLIHLSSSSNLFIPVLPHILSILDKVQLQKLVEEEFKAISKAKSKVESGKKEDNETKEDEDEDEDEKKRKEYNMDILNHVSLDEAHSLHYNIAVLEKLYELLEQYLASQCHKIAFPELVLLPLVQLKKWCKRNHDKHAQKFKALLDKIKSDCEKVEQARQSATFAFSDYTAVDAWQKKMKDSNSLGLAKLSQSKPERVISPKKKLKTRSE